MVEKLKEIAGNAVPYADDPPCCPTDQEEPVERVRDLYAKSRGDRRLIETVDKPWLAPRVPVTGFEAEEVLPQTVYNNVTKVGADR